MRPPSVPPLWPPHRTLVPTLWGPATRRVLVTRPDPSRPGGITAALRAVRPHLSGDVGWIEVGRRARLDVAALVRDPRHVARCRDRFDLLHVNPSLRWRALLRDLSLVRAWGGPAVAWLHGWDESLGEAIRQSPAAREAFRRSFARTRFAALAPVFAGRLAALGIPESQVDVVPPAWAGQPLAREPIPDTILFMGRVEPEKGVFELVRAASALGTKLIVAGTGSARVACGHLARSLRADVELPGWLDAEARWRALSRAAVFALPSYGEGVPVALIEAMAAGVPCVATRVGGVPWLTREGRLARLIDTPDPEALAEALRAALRDPGAVGEAQAHAASFAAPVIAAELERVWARALAA